MTALATAGAVIVGITATARAEASWVLPPRVQALPPRGSEGPPLPIGPVPREGRAPAATNPAIALEQDRVLLDGPFPRHGLTRGISDGTLMLDANPQQRTEADTLAATTGAQVARIPVNWAHIAPVDPAPGFRAEDPGDGAYRFATLDAAVRSAVAAGLQPLLVVSHAPGFAEAPSRWRYAYPGSWDPDPAALGQFASALARRYDGTFTSANGVLPRVMLLQAWNEPNLSRYLAPQWIASGDRWKAFSPLVYRELLNAFYASVKRAVPDDLVLSAGLAPNGDRAGAGRMAPVTFLQSLLCLRPAPRCAQPAHFDVLAYHPLSIGNPDRPALSSLDVSVADAGKVRRLLRDAERLRTVQPRGRKPLWVTELNWESDPPTPDGVTPALQAGWISRALHRLWIAGVSLVCWQFLVDPDGGALLATDEGSTVRVRRAAGLYEHGPGPNPLESRPKPFAIGFALPFDPLRVSRRAVRVWALLPSPTGTALLQWRATATGPWRSIASLRPGADSVINSLIRLRGRGRLRLLVAGRSTVEAQIGRGRWAGATHDPRAADEPTPNNHSNSHKRAR